jgi:hypothetical protein
MSGMRQESRMNDTSGLVRIGSCFCALIGVLYSVVAWKLLPDADVSVLLRLFLVVLAVLAFVPFVVCVFYRMNILPKPIFWSTATVEILVLGSFLWSILTD